MSNLETGSRQVWPRGVRRAAILWSVECVAILLAWAWSLSFIAHVWPFGPHGIHVRAVAIVIYFGFGGIPAFLILMMLGTVWPMLAAVIGSWLVVWWVGMMKIRLVGRLRTRWLIGYMVFCAILGSLLCRSEL